MSSRFGITLVYLLGCSATFPGCRDERAPAEGTGDRAGSIVQVADRGPVRMTVTVDKRGITLSERFNLTVEVVAPRGIDVEMPRLGERVTDLSIRDYRQYPAESFEGGWRRRQEYRLDAFLSGDYTIPEMTATFIDRRAGEDALAKAEVAVSQFTLTVRSLVEGELDPTAFRDIKGLVPLPFDRSWAWAATGGLAGAVVLTLAILGLLRHRHREAPEAVPRPHEWALAQLKKLIDEQLVERGLVREFYSRLSMIVRRYVERRFDLTAPMRTTEEFMLETQGSSRLPVEYHGTVGRFLGVCDRVKFARHAPHAKKISEALNTARDFVAQSAENDPERTTTA